VDAEHWYDLAPYLRAQGMGGDLELIELEN